MHGEGHAQRKNRKFDNSSSLILERTTLHTGVAMYEERTYGSDDSLEHLARFSYSNHLGSAALELDESAAIISYEEYHPYGTTSYQAMNASINATAKRYRYTGKERDEESGLYYHGARYYACWLARWTAVDPLEGSRAGLSGYNYCQNNPVMRHDPDGMQDKKKLKATTGQERAVTPYRTHQEGNVTVIEPITEAPPAEHTEAARPKPRPTPPKVGREVKELTKDLPKGGEQASKEFAEEITKELAKKEAKNAEKQVAESIAKKLLRWGRHVDPIIDVIIYAATPVELGKGDVWTAEQQYQQIKENPKYAALHLKSGLKVSAPDPKAPITPPQRVTNQPGKLTAQEIADASDRLAQGKGTALDKLYQGFGWLKQTTTPAASFPIIDLVGFRREHILNRHRSGAGISGKTEFPSSWNDQTIIDNINKIANDPTATGGMGKWNSPYKIGIINGVEVRVDFYPINHPKYAGKVSTAYPINVTPNP